MASLPHTMQAASCPRYGNHKNIIVVDRKIPTPKDHEILIKVFSTAITTADTMMRAGIPRFGRLFLGVSKPRNPYLGTGYSGEVVGAGKNVEKYKVGDEVFGESGLSFSANAQYVCVDSEGVLFKKPEALTHDQAACFCDGPLTSYNFVKEIGEAQSGQKILINGGAGSLGTSAIQIAKHFGCQITATCSPENFQFLKDLGAETVIDYKSDEFQKMKAEFDVVYDTVGKLKFSESKRLLAKEGKFISPVLSLGLLFSVLKQKMIGSKMTATFSATGLKKPPELIPFISNLLTIVGNENLRVHVEKTFSLDQISEAHGLIDSGHKKGNYVARIAD